MVPLRLSRLLLSFFISTLWMGNLWGLLGYAESAPFTLRVEAFKTEYARLSQAQLQLSFQAEQSVLLPELKNLWPFITVKLTRIGHQPVPLDPYVDDLVAHSPLQSIPVREQVIKPGRQVIFRVPLYPVVRSSQLLEVFGNIWARIELNGCLLPETQVDGMTEMVTPIGFGDVCDATDGETVWTTQNRSPFYVPDPRY